MASNSLIFNVITNPATEQYSVLFRDASFLWMEAIPPPPNTDIGHDVALQIFLATGVQRLVSLEGYESQYNEISTVAILKIPSEFLYSGYDMQLVIRSGYAINTKIYAVFTDCACSAQLSAIDTKINILVAGKLISIAEDILGIIVSGGASLILPAIARAGLRLLNQGAENVLIGIGKTPTLADYDLLIPPGASFTDELGFDGDIYAMTASGGNAPLKVKQFR